jgi:hypothetical protein
VTNISFKFCHDVIVPGLREEYQVRATLLTAMTKNFTMIVVLPPYDDTWEAISDLSDHHTWEARVACMKVVMG